MSRIDRTVDHIGVMCTPSDAQELSRLLQKAGFPEPDDVIASGDGLQSLVHPIAGGGFIELTSQVSEGSAHLDVYQQDTPQVFCVAYTSSDGAADLERLRALPGGDKTFACCGGWQRRPGGGVWGDDGTREYYVGIMPTALDGERPAVDGGVYFHIQDRRLFPLPYRELSESAPALKQVTVAGGKAEAWRERHAEWFQLPEHGAGLIAGDTELRFEQTDADHTEIVATFAVPNPDVEIPFARGRFVFEPLEGAVR